jgi:hypothetical protein
MRLSTRDIDYAYGFYNIDEKVSKIDEWIYKNMILIGILK